MFITPYILVLSTTMIVEIPIDTHTSLDLVTAHRRDGVLHAMLHGIVYTYSTGATIEAINDVVDGTRSPIAV